MSRTRRDYRTGTKELTDEQVLNKVYYYWKYLDLDLVKRNRPSTSFLTKMNYFEAEAKKRGYTKKQISDYLLKKYLSKEEEAERKKFREFVKGL